MRSRTHGDESQNQRAQPLLPVSRHQESFRHRRKLFRLASGHAWHHDAHDGAVVARLGLSGRSHAQEGNMTVTRRTSLALLGAGVLASRLEAAQAHLHAIRRNTEARRLIFFDPEAHRLIDALAEAIIPSDEHSPGARQAGVGYYIDLVAGNSAAAEQEQWRTEMAALEGAATSELGKAFLDATPAE